jgi:hypothetical protein
MCVNIYLATIYLSTKTSARSEFKYGRQAVILENLAIDPKRHMYH